MARDSYIIRPKRPVRPVPQPLSRKDKIRTIAQFALAQVARRVNEQPASRPRT